MIEETLYNAVILLSYLLILATYLGIGNWNPKYLSMISSIVNLYICLSLLIRFNMFRTSAFNSLDRRIAFHAGILLLSSTILNNLNIFTFANSPSLLKISSRFSSIFGKTNDRQTLN